MGPKITTKRVNTGGKGNHAWNAESVEPMFCLFWCASCGKTSLVRLNVDITVQKSSKDDALLELYRVRQDILHSLKTPGPKEGAKLIRAGCDCHCVHCNEPPVWVTEGRGGKKKDGLIGGLSVAALFAVVLCIMFLLPSSNMPKHTGMMLYIILMVLAFMAFGVINGLCSRRMWERIVQTVEDATREHPPLFGDSAEDVVYQARECGAYRDASVDTGWTDQAFGKNR